MVKSEAGFSTVEIVVAVMLLSVGVLGIARASADMTRALSQGDRMATAALYSQERIELLRAGGCDAMAAGTETKPGGYTLRWSVAQPTVSETKLIRMVTSYSSGRGTRADTVETKVWCP